MTVKAATEAAPLELRAVLAAGGPLAQPRLTAAFLVTADLASIVLARVAGLHIWRLFNPEINAGLYFDFGLTAALFLVVFAWFGLYAPAGLGPVEELRRSLAGSSLVAMTLLAAAFLAKESGSYSRGLFVVSGTLAAAMIPATRAILKEACGRRPWWGVPVLILGAGPAARRVVDALRAMPGLGFKPVACLDDEPPSPALSGVPYAGRLVLASAVAAEGAIRHAVVAMPDAVGAVERYCSSFRHVIVIPNLEGLASLWVSPSDLGGILGLEVRNNLLDPANRFVKRAADIVLALAVGIPALPLVAAAALWIRIATGGPAFFRQTREGLGGRLIDIWKLRTMHIDAADRLDRHLANDPSARLEWARYCKLRRDPRILPGVGGLLRRTSLDEFPQLWNVLRGDMSLVGPRPLPGYHLERFPSEFQALRRRVPPGLTGLWQVSVRSEGDVDSQRSLDTYYIRNWSLWLDLWVLTRTLQAIVFGRGAW
jgi:Undecaprenyl-phosphate galactose phosphotransferase WbaP